MAQTSQQHYDTRENQSPRNKSASQTEETNDSRRASLQRSQDTSLNSNDSNIIVLTDKTATPNPDKAAPTTKYQPSKSFILKCRAELDSLLDSIKSCYHDEIKALVSDKLYTDYTVGIGEEFAGTVHRCVLFSRAFKLYSSLRTFEIQEVQQEKDIVVSEFQQNPQFNPAPSQPEDELQTEETTPQETLNPFCGIPEGLIPPEQITSFLHRIYLNLDIHDEETQLNQIILQWIKVNRPEIVKPTKKICPNHKESFRTIQPDFESLSISETPAISGDMSDDLLSASTSAIGSEEKNESQSITESTTGTMNSPGLTRTETFEKISKTDLDSSKDVGSSGVASSSFSPDSSLSKTAELEPYAPTTRTGLKPKTFTTPIDVRSSASPNPVPASTITATNDSFTTEKDDVESSIDERQPTPVLTPKPAPTKRSSITPKTTTDTKQALTKSKTSSQVGPNGKTEKMTTITRAQPISMERSQSPGSRVTKGSGRNFIANNKRLISQIEKKIPLQNEQLNKDNEPELNNETSLMLETHCIDDVIANMDKFALISYSKLADALSRMFIDKLLTDTVILVDGGRQIDVHRCILAARSAYLSEIISKLSPSPSDDVAASQNHKLKIDMGHFSYSSVYFSMLHIYSGVVKVPDDVNLDELARLTNLLHVTTLSQVCMQTLRINYCHFFHKPCNVCCLGVLKTLPLAWRYDYTDLYQKCLQWIGSNFASIFCLKEFSDLKPNDLIEECYLATMNQLTPDNVIPKTIECQKLLKNLPPVKWTESVICLVGRLLEDFCHYVAENYEKILLSESFMNLKKNCWECEVLEENLLAAMNHLKPDSGCRTLMQLNKIECASDLNLEDSHTGDSFSNLIVKMRKYCERYLLKEATAVVHSSSWKLMSPSLKKKIKDQAILSTDFDEPTKVLASKPKLPSRLGNQASNRSSCNSGSDGVRSPSSRSTPDSKLKSSNTTLLPQPKNKTPASRHVKILK